MAKYRPSNGTEGMEFESKWCDRCALNTEDCSIIFLSMAFDIEDVEYPDELQTTDQGPVCTAFITKD